MKKVARVVWNELLPSSPVFSTGEVVELAEIEPANASRDLMMLAKEGSVTRIRRGLWAATGHPDFSPYAVVPHLFAEQPGGYVSLLSALSLHGMIDQIPHAVHVVTTSQRPVLRTPVGTYEFYRIQPQLFIGFELYGRSGNFDIATAEKALFDSLYFSARKGRRFVFLPEIELTENFSTARIEDWIEFIEHPPLRIAVRERWERVADRIDASA